MPISAFIIDAHMEVMFWIHRKKLDPSNRLTIGIFKILGDLFAGIFYSQYHFTVTILAVVAFVFDVLYIIYAVNERKTHPEIQEEFQRSLSMFISDLQLKVKIKLKAVNLFINKKILKKK